MQKSQRRAAPTIATGPVVAFPVLSYRKGEPFSRIWGTPLQLRAIPTTATGPVVAFTVLPYSKGEPESRIWGTPLQCRAVTDEAYNMTVKRLVCRLFRSVLL